MCDFLSDFTYGIFSARRLVTENRRLKEQLVAAEFYSEQMERRDQEISDLRKMIALPPLGRERVSAQVEGFFPYQNRITISAGTSQGIKAGMAVVCADGLVGLVETVSPGQSQVSLLTSFNRKIGAVDMSRKPPPAGLLQGKDFTTLTLTFLDPKAPVVTGDVIGTGVSTSRIPGGIIIGRVINVDDDPEYGTRRANVDPSVNFGTLREVFVLK